jgi:hypothetical protein
MRIADWIGCGLCFSLMIAYFAVCVPSVEELKLAHKIRKHRAQQTAIYVAQPEIIKGE